MYAKNRHVLITGAGIGGLSAAIALRQRGASVTVLEQADAIREVGAGLQISPNGGAVLRAIGVWNDIASRGIAARAVVLKDYQRSGDVLRLDLAQLSKPDDYVLLHRADLIETLLSHAQDIGVDIRLNQRVVSRLDGPGVVTEAGAHLTADAVVAADGVRSVLRAGIVGPAAPFFTGQVAWRAIVPNVTDQADHALVHMGPGRHLVSYPLRDRTCLNLVAVQERSAWQEEGWDHVDDPENLQAAFADFSEDSRAMLNAVTDLRVWGLFRHPVAKAWHRNGVVLLGDAAHPTLPFLAQGANLAIEDAWVLAAALDKVADPAKAFDAYQAARRSRVQRVVSAANRNARAYHLRFGPVRSLAHLGLAVAGKLAPKAMLLPFRSIYDHDVTK